MVCWPMLTRATVNAGEAELRKKKLNLSQLREYFNRVCSLVSIQAFQTPAGCLHCYECLLTGHISKSTVQSYV